MHILHISSDFCNTKVYTNLYKNLARSGIEQSIYCPVRDEDLIGRNAFEAEGTSIIYDYVVKPYHKYVYHIKRHDVFNSLQQKVELQKLDLCHAATLFTDGGQAYKIYKKFHVPYCVAVRNTDINDFLRYLPNTWMAGKKILLNAEKVFFISKALMNKFSEHRIIRPLLSRILDKMELVPNGIDDFYLDNINCQPLGGHKVLYVGDFSPNKNVLRLCEAVLQLRIEEEFGDVTLTLIGGGKTADDKVLTMINNHSDVFEFLGPIYDKEKLREQFRSHTLFAMPSITETFGLVYLEALSQNLPVVYTKGQGIDGLIDDSIGVRVDPLSVGEIKEAIKTILKTQHYYSNKTVNFERFRWSNIAQEYINNYNNILIH